MSWPLAILLALLVAALIWFFRRPDHSVAAEPTAEEDDIDFEVLDEAETEVRDVDAFTSPDEAEGELRDWGPGAPK